MTLAGVFYSPGAIEDRRKATEVAYSDVRRAFLYYLEHLNQGRPFLVASHSQVTLTLGDY